MNLTWPGRLHVIVSMRRVYLVGYAFGRRFELIRPALPHWRFDLPGE